MKIAILDPFHSGSHRAWSTGLARHSDHEIRIFSLPGRHWKWRMHGAALSLAKAWTNSGFAADMILTTDMMALDTFAAVCRHSLKHVNLAIYFHENQLTYPWSPDDPDTITGRDNHYAFINLTSALAADRLFFNSKYHLESFLGALPEFCRQFPPPSIQPEAETLKDKSAVLPPGIDLTSLDHPAPERRPNPVILWNHRWEYDKGPEAFFEALFQLDREGLDFELIILGEAYGQSPPIFAEARSKLADKILHWGFATSRLRYAQLLRQSDILPVTSRQDFFGISVIEAIYCGARPLLPRKLAYPDHFPPAEFPDIFYDSPKDLLDQLRTLLKNPTKIRQHQFHQQVAQYDWNTIISTYDQLLWNM